jgi:hypothetical protein
MESSLLLWLNRPPFRQLWQHELTCSFVLGLQVLPERPANMSELRFSSFYGQISRLANTLTPQTFHKVAI